MTGLIITILLFIAGGVCLYLFSMIAESNVGKWFLVNGLACIVAALVLLYVMYW